MSQSQSWQKRGANKGRLLREQQGRACVKKFTSLLSKSSPPRWVSPAVALTCTVWAVCWQVCCRSWPGQDSTNMQLCN